MAMCLGAGRGGGGQVTAQIMWHNGWKAVGKCGGLLKEVGKSDGGSFGAKDKS